MSKANQTKYEDLLDEEILQFLGSAPAGLEIESRQMQRLRDRVMLRVDEDTTGVPHPFITIKSTEGHWIEIGPRIKKKILYSNPDDGTESYLWKAEPGVTIPPHLHELDEHCIVLEGSVSFGDLHLEAGDYHFAARGSEHDTVRTETGVLLYIQMAQQGLHAGH